MIGRTLAHYRLTAALGAGGMGEVYRATDTKLGREVALKVLPAEMAESPERLERFRREARALATLDHPGIVTVHSVEEADGVHFLTMQLVEGEPLDKVIPEGGLPVDRILQIAGALLDALAAAHEKGIVHRDLKPANVMVTTDGRVKVLDFGLARMSGSADEPADSALPTEVQTREGVVMGTMPYMSPEQVSGRALDHRTDIFSLGVILYEMAAGRRPFQGHSSAELVSSILRDTPRPLGELRGDLPSALGDVIGRCLEKSTADRLASVRDLRAALRDVDTEAPATPTAAGPASRPAAVPDSGPTRADEAFRVAVLPFRYAGSDADVRALAEGLTEDIVTGLSRFSYLRVLARSSTARYAEGAADVRVVGHELGARYVMEGTLRRAGRKLRVAVQLVDTVSGAHLWAESYDRDFVPEELFDLQDDLVPRVVSTSADHFGVLARAISEAVRSKPVAEMTPYEALMRGFGYHFRLDPTEHAEAREALERAVELDPANADCWAMLSWVYSHEFAHGFNPRPGSLDRAREAARKAVDLAPSNHLAFQALAVALFFRRETAECRSAAERALTLNPLDGSNEAIFLITFTGDWDRGCTLIRRALELNPHHPRWYEMILAINEYRLGHYRESLDEMARANPLDYPWKSAFLAAAHAQLGEVEAARRALDGVLAPGEDVARSFQQMFEKWFEPSLIEHLMEGLRKAGMEEVEGGSSAARVPFVAVLPFRNLSSDEENEYFADGITEDVIAHLTRISTLKVISRSSVMPFKKREQSLREIGDRLGTSSILDGSVRRAGNRVRIVAQLVDVSSDSPVWAETYDRELTDIFEIQTDVALQIVSALRVGVSSGERARVGRKPTDDLHAYQLYLHGRHCFARYTEAGIREGMAYFEQAIEKDPSFALAHTALAQGYAEMGQGQGAGTVEPPVAFARAKESVARALALDDRLGEAHGIAALLRFVCDFDWEGAEEAFQTALELSPGSADIHDHYGWMCSALERWDDALRLLKRSMELDPLVHRTDYANTLLRAGRHEEASRQARRLLEVEPTNSRAHAITGWAALKSGDHEEGLAALERAVEFSPDSTMFQGQLGQACALAGQEPRAREILEHLQELTRERYVSPYHLAYVHAGLGEADAAMGLLEQAFEQRAGAIYGIKGSFLFTGLRSHPRFQALLKKMNLQEGEL